MLIRRWMTKNPTVIESTKTLGEAKRMMDRGKFRRLPVMEKGVLVGIITERDLRQQAGHLDHTRVDAVMAKPVITVTPDMLLDRVAHLMVKHKVGGFPVIEDNKVVGMITAIDLLRAFAEVLGAVEEGVSRVDLAFSGSSFDLAVIASLVGQLSGELLGMGSYEGEGADKVIYVRVRAEDAHRVADMLTQNDFSVLAIHQ